MTRAMALALGAGAVAVFAAWELLAAIERSRVPGALARAVAPLRRARREGRAATAPERRRLALLAAGTLLGAGWLLFGAVGGLLLAGGGPPVAFAALRARHRRYLAELGQGAPGAARALADALGGGHSIRGALAEAGYGLGGPAGTELRAVAASLELGEPTEQALGRLRARAGGGAWETIVAAILLNRDAGGDLARLLRGSAHALEDASRLQRDARSATAQARFTGLLVAALPLGAVALAELASPGYLGSLLRSPLAAWLAACAVGFALLALVAIRRLARVRA